MAETVNSMLQALYHRMGGSDYALDGRISFYQHANFAGRLLHTIHPWSWARSFVTLSAVANQSYINLPTDFLKVVEGTVPTVANINELRMVGMQEIMRLRAMDTFTPVAVTWICYEGWNPPATGGRPTPRAEIYPTPIANASPTITLLYQRGWATITDANINHSLPMPEEWERLYMLLLRETAGHLEEGEISLDQEDIAGELARLKALDNSRQPAWGRPVGGVSLRNSGPVIPHGGFELYP